MKKLILSCAGALLATSANAAVTYTFTAGANSNLAGSGFTYVAAGFLTSDIVLSAASLASCTLANPALSECARNDGDAIFTSFNLNDAGPDFVTFSAANGANGINDFFYFADGAFAAPGTYSATSLSYQGTLTVATDVPEPSTWAFIVAGFGAMGMALRRRTGLRARV